MVTMLTVTKQMHSHKIVQNGLILMVMGMAIIPTTLSLTQVNT